MNTEYTTPVCFGDESADNGSNLAAVPRQIARRHSDCSDPAPRRRRSSSRSASRKAPATTPRRPSFGSFGSLGALDDGDSYSEFEMQEVDVSKNYGHGTVPIRGRESHTADLEEFDRYLEVLRGMDRGREERIWKLGVVGMGLQDDDDGGDEHCENDGSHAEHDATKPPRSIGVEARENHNRLDQMFGNSYDDDDDDEPSNLRYPYNHKFWSHFRSILSKAKPVGFAELPDPTQTAVKTPRDASAFLSKVIAIKSINPIQPALLAAQGGFDESDVLAELLYATSAGLVAMRFAPECVRCGSAVAETDMLGRIPGRAECEGCNAPNVVDALDKIKVLFLLNSDVLYVLAENFACTISAESLSKTCVFGAVPATSTGSGFSYRVGTGAETEIAPALEPGRYRMRCPVAKTDNYLVVRRKTQENDKPVNLRMKVSDLVHGRKKSQPKAVLTVPHGRIQFDVFPDTRSFFVLWVQKDEDDETLMYLPPDERDLYTPASKVMHHPIFNALFQEQQVVAVPKDIFFSISNVVLVFTDVVDSTRLYTNLGDGEAFRLVRKHFQVLFAAFIKRGGRVVKTIGDAVMASFTNGGAALRGVADAMELLPAAGRRPDNNRYLEIRVGLHYGKSTVVPLNGVNDYFGQTTNIAARVQSVAKASECFVTEAVLESSPDAWECYNEITSPGSAFVPTPSTELRLKGVENSVRARGFRWVKRSRRQSELSSSFNSINSYFDRKEVRDTRSSFRETESSESDNETPYTRGSRIFDRPAEEGRRNSHFDPTVETDEEG